MVVACVLSMVFLVYALDAFTLIATEEEYKDGTIQCPQNEDCTIYCNEEEACEKAKIFCPVHNECAVWCGYGVNACKGATIDARYSSYFSLNDCESGDDSSCAEMKVYFPPNQNGAKIGALNTGNNFKRALLLYAIYGWLDVDTSGATVHGDVSSINAVMYCSFWYDSQCVVAADAWRCDDAQHKCNDPLYYTQQTTSTSTSAPATTTQTASSSTQTTAVASNNDDDDTEADVDVDVVDVDGYPDQDPADVEDTNDDADEQPSQSEAPVTSQASAEEPDDVGGDDGEDTDDTNDADDGEDVGDGDEDATIPGDESSITSTSTTSSTIVDPDFDGDTDGTNNDEFADQDDLQNDANLMEQQQLPTGAHEKGAAHLEYIIAVLVGCLCVCVVLFTYYVTRHTKFYRRAMDIDKTIEHQRQKSAGGRATCDAATAGADGGGGAETDHMDAGVTPQGVSSGAQRSKSKHNTTHPELEVIVDELQKIAEQNPLTSMLELASPKARRLREKKKSKSNKSLSGFKALFTHKLHQPSLSSMGAGESPLHQGQEVEQSDSGSDGGESGDHEGDRFMRQHDAAATRGGGGGGGVGGSGGKLPDMEIVRNKKYLQIQTIPDGDAEHDDADSVVLAPNPPHMRRHIPEIADQDSAESNPSLVGTRLSYCEYLKHKKPSIPFNIMPPTGSVTANAPSNPFSLQPPPALEASRSRRSAGHEPIISRMSSLSELTANGPKLSPSPASTSHPLQPPKHAQPPKSKHQRFDTHTLIAPRSCESTTALRSSMHRSKAKTNGAMVLRLNSHSHSSKATTSSSVNFEKFKSKAKKSKQKSAVYRLSVNAHPGDSDSVDTSTAPRSHQSTVYQSRSASKQTVLIGDEETDSDDDKTGSSNVWPLQQNAPNTVSTNKQEMLFGRHVIDDDATMTSRASSTANDGDNMSRVTSTNTKEQFAANTSRRSSSADTMDTFQVRKSIDSSAMSADTWLTTYKGRKNT